MMKVVSPKSKLEAASDERHVGADALVRPASEATRMSASILRIPVAPTLRLRYS